MRYDHTEFGASANVAFAPKIVPGFLPFVEPASRLNMPAESVTFVPRVSRGDFVMTFTTPVSALAPHTAEAGPRITSICLMSDMLFGRKSHSTRPKKSRYTDLPSSRTSCVLDKVDVACRLVTLMSRADS